MRAEDHRRDLTRDRWTGLIHSSVAEKRVYLYLCKTRAQKIFKPVPFHVPSLLTPSPTFLRPRCMYNGSVIVIDNSIAESLFFYHFEPIFLLSFRVCLLHLANSNETRVKQRSFYVNYYWFYYWKDFF